MDPFLGNIWSTLAPFKPHVQQVSGKKDCWENLIRSFWQNSDLKETFSFIFNFFFHFIGCDAVVVVVGVAAAVVVVGAVGAVATFTFALVVAHRSVLIE